MQWIQPHLTSVHRDRWMAWRTAARDPAARETNIDISVGVQDIGVSMCQCTFANYSVTLLNLGCVLVPGVNVPTLFYKLFYKTLKFGCVLIRYI